MKKLLVLLVLPLVMEAQPFFLSGTCQRYMNVGAITTLISRGATLSKNYTATKVETTQVYTGLSGFSNKYLNLMVTDSASILVRVKVGNGTTVANLSPSILVDSLSVTSNSGGIKTISLDTVLGGFDAVQFIFDFSSGATQGTSTGRAYEATYLWRR